MYAKIYTTKNGKEFLKPDRILGDFQDIEKRYKDLIKSLKMLQIKNVEIKIEIYEEPKKEQKK